MSIQTVCRSATLLLLMFGIATSQTSTPLTFWRAMVTRPLSGPDAEEKFLNSYKRAILPGATAPYFEGTVVSVARTTDNGRKVFLSMENNEKADAALLFDGHDWILIGTS